MKKKKKKNKNKKKNNKKKKKKNMKKNKKKNNKKKKKKIMKKNKKKNNKKKKNKNENNTCFLWQILYHFLLQPPQQMRLQKTVQFLYFLLCVKFAKFLHQFLDICICVLFWAEKGHKKEQFFQIVL